MTTPVVPVAALLLGMMVGCGGGAPATSGTGDGGSPLQSSGHSANPQGVPYPSPAAGYGHTARSGSTPGSIIANFKFRGFVNGVVPSPDAMTVISLADYYDPCGKTYKMIRLSASTIWCGPCNQETDAIVAGKADLANKGVVFLQAVYEGPAQGTAATQSQLESYMHDHASNFTEMLDPELGDPDLGGFFTSVPPWNADIDPRTMEMVTSLSGWAGPLDSELAAGLAAVARPAMYPVAKCP